MPASLSHFTQKGECLKASCRSFFPFRSTRRRIPQALGPHVQPGVLSVVISHIGDRRLFVARRVQS